MGRSGRSASPGGGPVSLPVSFFALLPVFSGVPASAAVTEIKVKRLGKKKVLPGLGGEEGPEYLPEFLWLKSRVLLRLDIEKVLTYGLRFETEGLKEPVSFHS